MRNADMPAMPTEVDVLTSNPMSSHQRSVTIKCSGITKREMMAMHICAAIVGSISSEECYQRIKSMSDNCGVKVSEWIARDATKQADALLAELERTRGESK